MEGWEELRVNLDQVLDWAGGKNTMKGELTEEAKTLVLKAFQTEDGLILTGQTFSGWFVQTGKWNSGFIKCSEANAWKDALEYLCLRRLVALSGVHLYKLTSKGRQLSDSLRSE